jgi:hypothetical protein
MPQPSGRLREDPWNVGCGSSLCQNANEPLASRSDEFHVVPEAAPPELFGHLGRPPGQKQRKPEAGEHGPGALPDAAYDMGSVQQLGTDV